MSNRFTRGKIFNKKKKGYEIFPHTADIGLRVFGRRLSDLFENAAKGTVELISDPRKIKAKQVFSVRIQSLSWESLLVEWLGEILYYFSVKKIGFSKFKIKSLEHFTLEALLWGEKLKRKQHPIYREIKAATYHNLKINRKNGNYVAEIIFDI